MRSGPPRERKFEDQAEYNGPASGCLDPGSYEFTIKDVFNIEALKRRKEDMKEITITHKHNSWITAWKGASTSRL